MGDKVKADIIQQTAWPPTWTAASVSLSGDSFSFFVLKITLLYRLFFTPKIQFDDFRCVLPCFIVACQRIASSGRKIPWTDHQPVSHPESPVNSQESPPVP